MLYTSSSSCIPLHQIARRFIKQSIKPLLACVMQAQARDVGLPRSVITDDDQYVVVERDSTDSSTGQEKSIGPQHQCAMVKLTWAGDRSTLLF